MHTITDIATRLGVTRSRLWQIIHERGIKPVFVGEPVDRYNATSKGTMALLTDDHVSIIEAYRKIAQSRVESRASSQASDSLNIESGETKEKK